MTNTTNYQQITKKYKREKFPVEIILEGPAIDFRNEKYDPLLNELQANILKHHRKAVAEHHFVVFENAEKGVALLHHLSKHITTARAQLDGTNPVALTVFMTYAGYEKLGISDNLIPKGDAFRNSFKDRVLLGVDDLEKSYNIPFDAILLFAYDDLPPLKKTKSKAAGRFWDYMMQEHKTPNLEAYCKTIVFEKGTLRDPMDKSLHFKENISNPRFFPGAYAGGRGKKKTQAIQSVKAAELPNLDLVLTRDQTGNTGFSCGSFGAFAKIKMNEKAFKNLVKDLEVKAGLDEKEALAYLLGRFPDGTPLTLSNSPLQLATNHFDYTEMIKTRQVKSAQEDTGSRCPFHAHIRKANPRTADSAGKRIVRRGTYFNNKTEDESGKATKSDDAKGLLFMSFQGSLEQQFEHILNDWMLSKVFIKNGETEMFSAQSGRDMLFAKAGDEYPLPRAWNSRESSKGETKKLKIKEPFVSFNGGVYFYAPCISFFERIEWFGEIAKAKANHLAKTNKLKEKGKSQSVIGQLHNFMEESLIVLGDKKVKKGKVAVLDDTQIILK